MNKKLFVMRCIVVATTIALLGTMMITVTPSEALAGAQQTLIVRAPPAVIGDNIYITWWTNRTGSDEVMFRVSNDAGATFGDKVNLSNTTTTDSQDAEIAADGSNVVVTWWERNQTSNEPAARISTDNGQTFGPVLKLASNGTIGNEGEGE